ncbi:hypothetical protein RHMOL_Rhmol09G0065400 [Rhododendron molle]|uniref:Uncharacterized protein n=1 Tax=Rhododendron molle TaxID=49168 RepID=A0ACC0MAJ0_RHOML|nr:hypothetical protein RHMOL_Rhmol09G0065400 [Rhododendron molle]
MVKPVAWRRVLQSNPPPPSLKLLFPKWSSDKQQAAAITRMGFREDSTFVEGPRWTENVRWWSARIGLGSPVVGDAEGG